MVMKGRCIYHDTPSVASWRKISDNEQVLNAKLTVVDFGPTTQLPYFPASASLQYSIYFSPVFVLCVKSHEPDNGMLSTDWLLSFRDVR